MSHPQINISRDAHCPQAETMHHTGPSSADSPLNRRAENENKASHTIYVDVINQLIKLADKHVLFSCFRNPDLSWQFSDFSEFQARTCLHGESWSPGPSFWPASVPLSPVLLLHTCHKEPCQPQLLTPSKPSANSQPLVIYNACKHMLVGWSYLGYRS